jgi:pilus assembly protein CpaE
MKICILSPNRQHLDEICRALQSGGHEVVAIEGGKSRMREVAERQSPELMIVDGMCCDVAELSHVEYVTTHHPGAAVLLLCPTQSPEFLIRAMQVGVREVLPSPPAAAALQAAIDRLTAKQGARRKTGRVLSFMSAKGGSGATFLASNLAFELASQQSVLLVDLNLQFGDALSFVHDGRPASTIADVAHNVSRLDASLLQAAAVKVTPTFSVLAAPEDIAQATQVQPAHVEAILSVAVTQYDFVLVDVPRSLDPVAVRALDASWRIHVVLQSALPDIRNTTRLLEAFSALSYPAETTELILNRFERRAEFQVEELKRATGAHKVHTIANSYRDVHTSINHGEPLAKAARGNPVARQLAEFASTLYPRPEPGKGLLGRLFRTA